MKAPNKLLDEIKSNSIGGRYGKFFEEQVHIYKVHHSRELMGIHALKYIIDKLSGWILYIPNTFSAYEDWDSFPLISSVFSTFPTPPLSYERWFPKKVMGFFILSDDLTFHTLEMKNPDHVDALGVSLRHPFLLKQNEFKRMLEFVEGNTDIALTYGIFKAGIHLLHNDPIGTLDSSPRIDNREYQKKFIPNDKKFLYWLGLSESFYVYGKSLLGMKTEDITEIVAKYGTRANFETEIESLKYD
jgi:hypothetical protein